MGTTCLQCGCRGFTNAFVYCVKCLHVVVHRYCLDIITDNNEFIHWVCDECKDEAQNRKSTVDRHTCVEPIIRPIWMGSFHIWNKKPSLLDGVIARVSSRACQEVYEESNQFQIVLHLEMLPKSAVWPKSFEISEPSAGSIAIALYFFPSEISESDFDLFVDGMMHKELAMRAFVQNAELLVFTSKDCFRFTGVCLSHFCGYMFIFSLILHSRTGILVLPTLSTKPLRMKLLFRIPRQILSVGTISGKAPPSIKFLFMQGGVGETHDDAWCWWV